MFYLLHIAAEGYVQQVITTSNRIPTLNNDWDEPTVHVTPVKIEMTSFETKRKYNEYWFSPGFLSHVGGYKMCLCVQANGDHSVKGTHMSLYVHLMVGDNDKRLEWPFRGTVKVELLNRRHDQHHYSQEITFDTSTQDTAQRPVNGIRINSGLAASKGQGEVMFIPHKTLFNDDKDNQIMYLEDNCIKLQVKEVSVISTNTTIQPPLSPLDTEVLLFEIKNFKMHVKSKSEQISKPFYSHGDQGYKFALFVYPNGRDNYSGKSVSVFVHLMKGEYDSQLNWPFRGTIVVQILNVRDDHKGHVERPVSFTQTTDPKGKYGAQVAGFTTWFSSGHSFEGYGYHDMLLHKYLDYNEKHNTQYLSDDVLKLRITKIELQN